MLSKKIYLSQSANFLLSELSYSLQEEIDLKVFLNEYSNYFMDSILRELSSLRRMILGLSLFQVFYRLISFPIVYQLPNKKT